MRASRLVRPARQPLRVPRPPFATPARALPILARSWTTRPSAVRIPAPAAVTAAVAAADTLRSPLGRRPFSHAPPRRASRWWPSWDRDEVLRRRLAEAEKRPLVTRERLRAVARSPTLHGVMFFSAATALAFYFWNLETVPVSGRRRFNCFGPDSKWLRRASDEQARRLEYEYGQGYGHDGGGFLPEGDWRVRLVRRVLARLIPFSGMKDAQWEVHVIDEPRKVNAFVLPGGQVYVFSGLIRIARSEAGLAAVLGHEVAHIVAEHAAERLSSQLGINMLFWSLVLLTGGLAALGTGFFAGKALDLLFERPMDRLQETEADYLGLMMMSEACYDPRAAVGFWSRMDHAMRNQESPEWMSTHPSNHNRVQKISEWMPEAVEKLKQSDCRYTTAFADQFKRRMEGMRNAHNAQDIVRQIF